RQATTEHILVFGHRLCKVLAKIWITLGDDPGRELLGIEISQESSFGSQVAIDVRRTGTAEIKLAPQILEHVFGPGTRDRAVGNDAVDGVFGAQERGHDPPYAVAKDKNRIGVAVPATLEHLEALPVSIELSLEIDITRRSALTVATSGFVDAQGYKSVPSEVIGDRLVNAKHAGRIINRERADTLNQKQRRVLSLFLGSRDDGSQSTRAAGNRSVDHIVRGACFAWPWFELYFFCGVGVTAPKRNGYRCVCLAAGNFANKFAWTGDLCSVQRDENIARLETSTFCCRTWNYLLDHDSGPRIKLDSLAHLI